MMTMNTYTSFNSLTVNGGATTIDYKVGSTPTSFNIALDTPCVGDFVFYNLSV